MGTGFWVVCVCVVSQIVGKATGSTWNTWISKQVLVIRKGNIHQRESQHLASSAFFNSLFLSFFLFLSKKPRGSLDGRGKGSKRQQIKRNLVAKTLGYFGHPEVISEGIHSIHLGIPPPATTTTTTTLLVDRGLQLPAFPPRRETSKATPPTTTLHLLAYQHRLLLPLPVASPPPTSLSA